MIIDCISDLHGFYPELPGGDLLIMAGDLTATDSSKEVSEFDEWFSHLPYKKRIFIAGNHDNYLVDENPRKYMTRFDKKSFERSEYLCDSGTEFMGYRIWGSPWSKSFPGMNPKCKAFVVDTEEELNEKFSKIPNEIDILITHSPAYGTLDINTKGLHCGSISLMRRVNEVKPRAHIFGHLHESYGVIRPNLDFINLPGYPIRVNASHVNELYEPVNKPIMIEV